MKLIPKNIYIFGMKPQTDWRRILGTGLIIAIVTSTYGIFFYRQFTSQDYGFNLEVPKTEEVSKQTNSDEKMELKQTIEYYMNKKSNYEKMLSELKN